MPSAIFASFVSDGSRLPLIASAIVIQIVFKFATYLFAQNTAVYDNKHNKRGYK